MDEFTALAEKVTSLVMEKIQELTQNPMQIPVGISARHIHLCKNDVEKLFGEGYRLTPMKYLSQPGQFACEEMVEVIGSTGKVIRLRVLGPERADTQVELSLSDSRGMGIIPPVRTSGDIAGTPGIKLRGPKGETEIREGVMIADRHIHMLPEDADWFGVKNGERVDVVVDGAKGGIMSNVIIRVTTSSRLDFHVDTDDGNAFQLRQGQLVTIRKRNN